MENIQNKSNEKITLDDLYKYLHESSEEAKKRSKKREREIEKTW